MRASSDYIRQLRVEAGRRLPADFARRVVGGVQRRRRHVRRARVTALTGVVCAFIAVSALWLVRDDTVQANVRSWHQVYSQLVTIQDTL